MEFIREFAHAGRTVKVYIDPDPINPRKDYDNSTIMVHWHRKYDLGDEYHESCTAEELKEEYADKGDPILHIMPLYLYDHSGLSISTGGFTCSFDSGQVGWVFVTQSKKDLMEFGEMTAEQWESVIKSDTKVYDDYLTGAVYGYEVTGKDGDHLESCWGYIGDIDYCISEAKSAAEHATDPAVFGDDTEEHY